MSILTDGIDNLDSPALVCEDQALTWRQLDEWVDRLGAALRAATAQGGRVGVLARNGIEMATVHLAGLLASVPVVPLNPTATAAEVSRTCALGDVRVLFADAEALDRAPKTVGDTPVEVVALGTASVGSIGAADTADTADTADIAGDGDSGAARPLKDWVPTGAVEPLSGELQPCPPVIFTSGTTGTPKGTMLPQSAFGGATTTAQLQKVLRTGTFGGTSAHLVVGPLYHTGPLTGLRSVLSGATVVIMRRFDAAGVLDLVERYRIEGMVTVPTHFIRLLQLPADVRDAADVSSLRAVSHTGSSCPVWVKRAMIDWWGPVFDEAYGASESGTVCRISSAEWLERPGSVGRAIPPFEAVVVDDAGQPVASGTEGYLYFRDQTGQGISYVDDPEKTAAAHLEPGVFTLGEIGYLDDEGYVYITDRAADMVVSGGVNIYPAEAEQVLLRHGAVADAGCVGAPHPDMGEQLVGVVVAHDRPTDPENLAAELISHCREHLAPYKCPRSVEFVDELPRNAMGKINKTALAAGLEKRPAVTPNGAPS